eukprot:TRINITY_DN114_c0_g1_i1.p1 TRINITY_DN114_c0_g1~~TRINITY_DN114_c0_g1_i1.p1  ORF type:complete len:183 (+),score=54.30 TRINITY_DN114_c0_g1_i1:32-550(+)
MAEATSTQTIKLESSDGQIFEVPKRIAEMSITVKHMMDDIDTSSEEVPIPVPNVNGKILEKVIEYCKYHDENPDPPEEKKDERIRTAEEKDFLPWDKEYLKIDKPTLYQLILAANYLDIKPLLDVTCKSIAWMIKGKTPQEIRKEFDIKNDFTPEEEEQVRKDNQWCLDLCN